MFIQLHTAQTFPYLSSPAVFLTASVNEGLAIFWCLMAAVGLPLLYPTMNRWSKIHYLWLFRASKILSCIVCFSPADVDSLLVFHICIYV
ncbi:hypothetical protein C8J56DRAFT_971451, partial [Mycena floridula]